MESENRTLRALFPLVSFVCAFLLFQVQPIVSKLSLPFYGGAAAVWNTAMMFFQGVLLVGYASAHLLSARWTLSVQVGVYCALIGMGAIAAFVAPGFSWEQPLVGSPIASLVLSLALHVGLSFLALSITAPLLQAWFVRVFPSRSPYLLYAASNAGSLIALLSYPFFIEPMVGLAAQQRLWANLYLVACALIALLGMVMLRQSSEAVSSPHPGPLLQRSAARAPLRLRGLWLAYSALSSVILMGATSVLCYDVAPMPLFLVVPLAIYLLTFVLCFSERKIYHRGIYFALFTAHALGYGMGAVGEGELHVLYSSIFILILLYASCMCCHGELYKLRPQAADLTSFYLHLSIGGFFGSVCAALIAPFVFNDGYHELALAIALLAILLSGAILGDQEKVFPGLSLKLDRILVGGLPIVIVGALYWHFGRTNPRILHHSRSFYGILRVFDAWEPSVNATTRHLVNGRIRHGSQLMDPAREMTPISYYGIHGGFGLTVSALRSQRGSLRVGVVGLGAGAAMGYARGGDYFRLYELNPDVIPVAKTLFRYLSTSEEGPQDAAAQSKARYEIVEGDGRLALAGESPQQFDLLLIDAFTSDAIPTHLLTVEAVQLYFRHLKPGGILLFHISNRHLDLAPVVLRIGRTLAISVRFLRHDGSPVGSGELPSLYAALSRDTALLQNIATPVNPSESPGVAAAGKPAPLWTDDFTSLFGVLNFIPPWESLAVSLGIRLPERQPSSDSDAR